MWRCGASGCLLAVSWMLLAATAPACAQQTVRFGQAPELTAYYYRVGATAAAAPAIVGLHGCAGMLNREGKPNVRTQSYAQLLGARGWHVLFVDSLTPRGLKSVCGDTGDSLAPARRVPDVQAAVAWLAARKEVDTSRIGILGWSHGGSVTLLANARGVDYATPPKAAVAFYPGCGARTLPTHWEPGRHVLLQLGADDDWTDPGPCVALTKKHPDSMAQDLYRDAGHGFDSDAPRREMVLRLGTRLERRVHIGGNVQANVASKARVLQFLEDQFAGSP